MDYKEAEPSLALNGLGVIGFPKALHCAGNGPVVAQARKGNKSTPVLSTFDHDPWCPLLWSAPRPVQSCFSSSFATLISSRSLALQF